MHPSFGLFLESRGYWGSQGAGILAIATDTGKWLLGLRSNATTFEPGTWALIGGKMDENNPRNAAKREFIEETGYQGTFDLHQAHTYKSPEKGENGEPKFVYHNFVGEIVKGHWEPKLNWETAKFIWVDYEGLQKIKPKHFGLIELLRNSDELIRYLSKKHQP
jgi:8-oxo-dGTP pyrophosphatase MutT (NUDIX family)